MLYLATYRVQGIKDQEIPAISTGRVNRKDQEIRHGLDLRS